MHISRSGMAKRHGFRHVSAVHAVSSHTSPSSTRPASGQLCSRGVAAPLVSRFCCVGTFTCGSVPTQHGTASKTGALLSTGVSAAMEKRRCSPRRGIRLLMLSRSLQTACACGW